MDELSSSFVARVAHVCAVAIPLVACGGVITNADGGGGTDGAVKSDSPSGGDASLPPFDAGAFCSGSTPRLMINGADAPILGSSGKANILNCCDSAELTLDTANYQAPMYFMWRAPPLGGAQSIDLANAPQGFSIEMDLGCDPATTSCATVSPEERYTDGFTGTLQYATGNGGLVVSYCLQVAESPSQPHTLIHSLMLYAPNVQ